MREILSYLNNLTPKQQAEFASRSQTTVGYLRKAGCKGQRISSDLCIRLERESRGALTCEALRPDVDWGYIRGSAAPAPQEPWDGVTERRQPEQADHGADSAQQPAGQGAQQQGAEGGVGV